MPRRSPAPIYCGRCSRRLDDPEHDARTCEPGRNAGRKPRDPSGAAAPVQILLAPAERVALDAAAEVLGTSRTEVVRAALRAAGVLPAREG